MKNRYSSLLQKHNQEIIKLCPYNPTLFRIGAYEIARTHKKGQRVLEVGSGEGDSALPILENTNILLDLLDVSPEMIAVCKKNLKPYAARTKFICDDAYSYLKRATSYDTIFTAWTIHNFKQKDKEKLIRTIFENLKPSGTFVLMDKVYPSTGGKELMERQNKRYTKYAEPEVAKAIIAHEIEDASDEYRMDEKSTSRLLKEVGFKSIEIADRIERDIVLIAQK